MGKPSFNTKAETDNRNRARNNPDTTRQKSFSDKQLSLEMKAAQRRKLQEQQIQEEQEAAIEAAEAIDPTYSRMTPEQMEHNGVRVSLHSMDTEEVIVHRYNPARDVACNIMGVPYGTVRVACAATDIRSHELHLDNKDRSAFLPTLHTKAERGVWETWLRETNDAENKALGRIQRRVCAYRRAGEDAIAAELQAGLALSGI